MWQSWVPRETRCEDEGRGGFESQARLQRQSVKGKRKEQDATMMITVGRGRQGAI